MSAPTDDQCGSPPATEVGQPTVRAEMRKMLDAEERPPTPTEFDRQTEVGMDAVYDHYDEWRVAVADAGGEPEDLPSARSDMDVIAKWDDLVADVRAATSLDDWADILRDHTRMGNSKMRERVAIFNMGTANECPNLNTEHCQVPDGWCYAKRDEHFWPHTLYYRRRQGYIWDRVDAGTFGHAFARLVERKHNPVDYLRFNESGDLRHVGDAVRLERVAQIVKEEADVDTFTYTASDYVPHKPPEDRTVVINASNADVEGADQRFIVVDDADEIPEDGYQCPYPEDGTNCGDCLACMHAGGSGDVYEVIRERKNSHLG